MWLLKKHIVNVCITSTWKHVPSWNQNMKPKYNWEACDLGITITIRSNHSVSRCPLVNPLLCASPRSTVVYSMDELLQYISCNYNTQICSASEQWAIRVIAKSLHWHPFHSCPDRDQVRFHLKSTKWPDASACRIWKQASSNTITTQRSRLPGQLASFMWCTTSRM